MNRKYICLYKQSHGYYVLYRYPDSETVYFDCYDNDFKIEVKKIPSSARITLGTHGEEYVQLNRSNLESYDDPDLLIPIRSKSDLDKYFMVEELLR